MPRFKDPKTGQIVNVNYFLVFLSCLLFGLFFFLYIGETQHALVMVGFAILIALVGIFVSPIAILYAYIFPLIYSFIAPRIVKDKWLNKGYLPSYEKIELDSEKIIEAINLAIKIHKYSPNNFTKYSSSDVSIYEDEYFRFYIDKFPPKFPYKESQILISYSNCIPINGKLLKVGMTNNSQISKIYYNHLGEEDITRMRKTLDSYKN